MLKSIVPFCTWHSVVAVITAFQLHSLTALANTALLNVDIGGGLAGNGKAGFAAVGQSTNDFWNFYTRDDGVGGWRTFGVLSNLKSADGTTTAAGLSVANAPGSWGNGSSDPMYNGYDYPFDGGNVTLTLTNLPAGQYDFYLYANDGKDQLVAGGVNYGIKTCLDVALTSPPVWQEGVQYVRYRNVPVSAGQSVIITVQPGVYGYAIISGMQIAAVSTTPPLACLPPASGLVSWWRAEGNAFDGAGSNHGTLAGAVGFGVGEVGQAFSFDGTGEVVVPSTASLNVQSVTFEIWVNPSVVDSDVDTILNKENDPAIASSDISYEIGIRGAVNAGDGSIPVGHLAFFLGGIAGLPDEYGGGWVDGGAAVPTDHWSHCALAFDGTTVRVYVNGTLTRTIGGLSGTMNSTTGPFKIGSRSSSLVSGRPELRFNGLIDEVSVYNRALSSTEIQAIYNAGNAGKCSPPPPPPAFLMNIDVGAGLAGSAKVGPAAVGQSATDFWNLYTRDDGAGGWRTLGATPNLKTADGAATAAGLIVANAPGSWGNGSTDPMYDGYDYPFDGGNVTLTLTNLPAGQYDFYLYASDGNDQLVVGGTDYGLKPCLDVPLSNPPVWREGVQYVRYRNVAVRAGQVVVITVRPGAYGYAVISGMQLVAAAGPPPAVCVAAPAGLVSWWRAENNATDSAGGNNGTLAGGLSFAVGEVGKAFSFDGTGEVVVPNSSSLNLQSLTFEAWINPSVVDSDVDTILNKENDPVAVSSDISYEIGIRGAVNAGVGSIPVGHLAFFLGGIVGSPDEYGGGWVDGGAAVPANQWTHCALAFDGTTVSVYVNGALTRTIGGLSGTVNSTTGPFKIGSRSSSLVSGRPELRFNGFIDEVSVYNRALTTDEIQAIYNAGSAGKCLPPSSASQNLIDVDFGFGSSSSKAGFAATGQTANDYWNFYTRDDGSGGYRTFGAVSNLKFANGAVSSVGLTVANAPGAWGNGSSDPMYQINVYPFDGGNITVTVTNLPVGQYDLYLYNQQGNYQVTVGETDYGNKTTSDPEIANPPVWQEGKQYALFRNVQVAGAGQAVTITVRPGVGGLALISGMQVVRTGDLPPSSAAFLINVDVGAGLTGSTKVGPAAVGQSNDFWNFYTRDDPAGGWRTFGAVSNLKSADGTTTAAGLSVANAPGSWGNGSSDPMYNGYDYPFDGGNVTLTLTNLPAGQYDFYLYANDGKDQLVTGGVNYGIKTCLDVALANPPVWQEGIQYVRYRNIPVNAGQSVVITVQPGVYGYAIISGMQIAAVLRVNHPPVADATATVPLVISPNNTNATIALDGSRSSDPDGDPLQYLWFDPAVTGAFATGIVSIVTLPVGTNVITLVVNDGFATGTNHIIVQVVTPAQAAERLAQAVTNGVPRSNPLIATFAAAIASMDRGNPAAAVNQLQAFQNKVQAQVAPLDSALAAQFIQAAQDVIDALSGLAQGGEVRAKIYRAARQINGKFKLQLSASPGRIYIVQASPDLVHWATIGVARPIGDSAFDFEDTNAPSFAGRFYRVVSP